MLAPFELAVCAATGAAIAVAAGTIPHEGVLRNVLGSIALFCFAALSTFRVRCCPMCALRSARAASRCASRSPGVLLLCCLRVCVSLLSLVPLSRVRCS